MIFHIMGACDEVEGGGERGGIGGVKDVLNTGELTLPRCGLFFRGAHGVMCIMLPYFMT